MHCHCVKFSFRQYNGFCVVGYGVQPKQTPSPTGRLQPLHVFVFQRPCFHPSDLPLYTGFTTGRGVVAYCGDPRKRHACLFGPQPVTAPERIVGRPHAIFAQDFCGQTSLFRQIMQQGGVLSLFHQLLGESARQMLVRQWQSMGLCLWRRWVRGIFR